MSTYAEQPVPTIDAVYSRQDIVKTERIITSGTEKRVADVVLRRADGSETDAILKFMRPQPFGNSNLMPREQRIVYMEEEIEAFIALKKLMPRHVPAFLGRYRSRLEGVDGFVVEKIRGETIGGDFDPVKHLPPENLVDEYQEAVLRMYNNGLYLFYDSMASYNLMLGTTETIHEPSIIMVEPQLFCLTQQNEKDRQR